MMDDIFPYFHGSATGARPWFARAGEVARHWREREATGEKAP
jgi:hypothetical protein